MRGAMIATLGLFDMTQGIRVTPKEPRLIRTLNSKLILTCSGASDLEWIGPDGMAVSDSRSDTLPYVQRIRNDLRLRIPELTYDQTGDYTCRSVSDGADSYEIRNIDIRQEINFVDTPLVQKFLLGTEAEIRCDVTTSGEDITTEWILPDGQLVSKEPALLAENYVIDSITDDDAGFYTCSISTTTGDVFDQEIEVEVEYSPTIADFPTAEYVVTVGENLEINCQSDGNPEPEITWQRIGSDGSEILYREGPRLSFQEIHVENSGEYQCKAENIHGIDDQKIQVIVVPPPTILIGQLEISADHPFEIILGQEVEIECSNEIVPGAEFVWKMPNGRQQASATVKWTATSGDSGDWECTSIIRRDFETIETTKVVNLQVQFAPKPVSTERIIYSYPARQTEIRCDFEANPLANTTLTGQGQDTTVHGNSISKKFTPKENDFPSNYTCHGVNDIGEHTYELKLEMASTPKALRNIQVGDVSVQNAEITFQPDSSEGQIGIETVIVTLKAQNRPTKVLRMPSKQNRIKLSELEPETDYSLTIQGQNVAGSSPISNSIRFRTKPIAAPTLNINEITTKNGQYYVVWDLVQNGGGKLRKLSLEYGKYEENGEMKRTHQETHLPKESSGWLKLKNLEVDQNYWVMMTAHNEALSSKTAKVDFKPLDEPQNKVLILSICLLVVVLLLGAGLDVGLYFTKRCGILNAIINRQVRSSGTRHLSSENSSSGTEEEQRLSPDEKLPIDESDGGLINIAETENETSSAGSSPKKSAPITP